ncbi:MAG: DsbA family protein [Hyphomonadaceae bacterium]
MPRAVIASLFLAVAAVFALAGPARAAPMTPDQEARVRSIVREYLVQNPEVIEEALKTLEARRIAQRRQEIERDPRRFAIGPANAKITIVEFFDYRCPYCHAAYDWLNAKLSARKDIRYVFVEFPILGPSSLEASRAALASMKQGRYLAFHAALMRARGELTAERINALAKQNGIDVARMRRDMGDAAIMPLLTRNHELAADSKVEGTPAFMINGEFFYGFDPQAMDRALRKLSAPARKS